MKACALSESGTFSFKNLNNREDEKLFLGHFFLLLALLKTDIFTRTSEMNNYCFYCIFKVIIFYCY